MERWGPLAGVRVLDFSWIVAGPQATRILADFGAQVIKVEYEARADPMRFYDRAPGTQAESLEASGLFNNMNRNKLSLALNLLHPKGLERESGMPVVSAGDRLFLPRRCHAHDREALSHRAEG